MVFHFFSLLFVLLAPFTQIALVRSIHAAYSSATCSCCVCSIVWRHTVNTCSRGTAGLFWLCLVWNSAADCPVHVLRRHRDALRTGILLSRSIHRGLPAGSAVDTKLSGCLSLIARPLHSWIQHLLIQPVWTANIVHDLRLVESTSAELTDMEGQLYAGVECLLIGHARGKHQ